MKYTGLWEKLACHLWKILFMICILETTNGAEQSVVVHFKLKLPSDFDDYNCSNNEAATEYLLKVFRHKLCNNTLGLSGNPIVTPTDMYSAECFENATDSPCTGRKWCISPIFNATVYMHIPVGTNHLGPCAVVQNIANDILFHNDTAYNLTFNKFPASKMRLGVLPFDFLCDGHICNSDPACKNAILSQHGNRNILFSSVKQCRDAKNNESTSEESTGCSLTNTTITRATARLHLKETTPTINITLTGILETTNGAEQSVTVHFKLKLPSDFNDYNCINNEAAKEYLVEVFDYKLSNNTLGLSGNLNVTPTSMYTAECFENATDSPCQEKKWCISPIFNATVYMHIPVGTNHLGPCAVVQNIANDTLFHNETAYELTFGKFPASKMRLGVLPYDFLCDGHICNSDPACKNAILSQHGNRNILFSSVKQCRDAKNNESTSGESMECSLTNTTITRATTRLHLKETTPTINITLTGILETTNGAEQSVTVHFKLKLPSDFDDYNCSNNEAATEYLLKVFHHKLCNNTLGLSGNLSVTPTGMYTAESFENATDSPCKGRQLCISPIFNATVYMHIPVGTNHLRPCAVVQNIANDTLFHNDTAYNLTFNKFPASKMRLGVLPYDFLCDGHICNSDPACKNAILSQHGNRNILFSSVKQCRDAKNNESTSGESMECSLTNTTITRATTRLYLKETTPTINITLTSKAHTEQIGNNYTGQKVINYTGEATQTSSVGPTHSIWVGKTPWTSHQGPTASSPTQSSYTGPTDSSPTQSSHIGPTASSPTQSNHIGQTASSPTRSNHIGHTASSPTQSNHTGRTTSSPTQSNHIGRTASSPTQSNHIGQTASSPTQSNHIGQTASSPTQSNHIGQTASSPTQSNHIGQTASSPTQSNHIGHTASSPTQSNHIGHTASSPTQSNHTGRTTSNPDRNNTQSSHIGRTTSKSDINNVGRITGKRPITYSYNVQTAENDITKIGYTALAKSTNSAKSQQKKSSSSTILAVTGSLLALCILVVVGAVRHKVRKKNRVRDSYREALGTFESSGVTNSIRPQTTWGERLAFVG